MACETIGDNCPRPGDSDNILLRKILLALNEVGGEGGSAGLIEVVNSLIMTPAEDQYWQDRAVLLDPRAYDFISGSNIAVPAGVYWYALSVWGFDSGASIKSKYLREANADEPLLLPSGTVLTQTVGDGHVYLCKPELVIPIDARYATGQSAKALYFTRLMRLKSMVLHNLNSPVPSTTPFGTIVSVDFPVDFSSGLISEVSNFDIAWSILSDAANTGGIIFTKETSDDHQDRIALTTIVPFNRVELPRMRSRPATISGTNGSVVLPGYGNLFYYKLPSDW